MPGSSESILRLQKSTPGTSRGSTQWSPLQALGLSSITRAADFADRGVPAGAVALVVADDQVRRRVKIRSAIEIAGQIHLTDGNLIEFLVAEAGEFGDELVLESFRFRAGLNYALGFAAAKVEIQSAEAETVGAGAGPVDRHCR